MGYPRRTIAVLDLLEEASMSAAHLLVAPITHHGRGRVPLARRNLLADRRRLAASVIGVALAVMLILLLDGMWAGIRQQTTAYTDRVGADLYVLQPGVRDLTAGASTLPRSTVEVVRADPEVDWVSPVRSTYSILQLHGTKVAVYAIGTVPGEHGGPWSITEGRAARTDDEIVIGSLLADRHGIDVGDDLDVMGHALRVVGRASTNGFMMSFVFVTHAALDALAGGDAMTSFLVVGTDHPAAVRDRLRAAGLNALDRESVAANDLRFAVGIFGSPVRLMVGIAFAAGTMIIALTAYTAILERRREYGIVKAMGATRGRLVAVALGQTLALAGLGLVVGWVLFVAGRWLIVSGHPQFTVLLTRGAVARAALAALAMALLAAVVPARRLAELEPAVAYRSTS
jgi:putative ABC transport system permease protein